MKDLNHQQMPNLLAINCVCIVKHIQCRHFTNNESFIKPWIDSRRTKTSSTTFLRRAPQKQFYITAYIQWMPFCCFFRAFTQIMPRFVHKAIKIYAHQQVERFSGNIPNFLVGRKKKPYCKFIQRILSILTRYIYQFIAVILRHIIKKITYHTRSIYLEASFLRSWVYSSQIFATLKHSSLERNLIYNRSCKAREHFLNTYEIWLFGEYFYFYHLSYFFHFVCLNSANMLCK